MSFLHNLRIICQYRGIVIEHSPNLWLYLHSPWKASIISGSMKGQKKGRVIPGPKAAPQRVWSKEGARTRKNPSYAQEGPWFFVSFCCDDPQRRWAERDLRLWMLALVWWSRQKRASVTYPKSRARSVTPIVGRRAFMAKIDPLYSLSSNHIVGS